LNASKALAQVLRIKGQSVSACKGNIPHNKKVQYKGLYNAGQLKLRESKPRKAEVDDNIADSQLTTVAAHFPTALMLPDQRKQPFESPINEGRGGASQQHHHLPLLKGVGEVLDLRRRLFSPQSNHHPNANGS